MKNNYQNENGLHTQLLNHGFEHGVRSDLNKLIFKIETQNKLLENLIKNIGLLCNEVDNLRSRN